jgi:hypothetical protein
VIIFWTAGGNWKRRRVLVTATRLLPPSGQLLVGQPEILDQLLVGAGLLERVEVLAMQVFDQCLLHAVDVRDVPHDGRDGGHPGALGGSPAALPRYQLVFAVRNRPHQDGLQDAHLPDRRGQRSQRFLVEGDPRLMGVGPD